MVGVGTLLNDKGKARFFAIFYDKGKNKRYFWLVGVWFYAMHRALFAVMAREDSSFASISGALLGVRCGEVAEWSNAAVSKTVIPVSGIGGSNPPLSAIVADNSELTIAP